MKPASRYAKLRHPNKPLEFHHIITNHLNQVATSIKTFLSKISDQLDQLIAYTMPLLISILVLSGLYLLTHFFIYGSIINISTFIASSSIPITLKGLCIFEGIAFIPISLGLINPKTIQNIAPKTCKKISSYRNKIASLKSFFPQKEDIKKIKEKLYYPIKSLKKSNLLIEYIFIIGFYLASGSYSYFFLLAYQHFYNAIGILHQAKIFYSALTIGGLMLLKNTTSQILLTWSKYIHIRWRAQATEKITNDLTNSLPKQNINDIDKQVEERLLRENKITNKDQGDNGFAKSIPQIIENNIKSFQEKFLKNSQKMSESIIVIASTGYYISNTSINLLIAITVFTIISNLIILPIINSTVEINNKDDNLSKDLRTSIEDLSISSNIKKIIDDIKENSMAQIRNLFVSGCSKGIMVCITFPLSIIYLAPRFLAKTILLGGFTQTVLALNKFQDKLSLVINEAQSLSKMVKDLKRIIAAEYFIDYKKQKLAIPSSKLNTLQKTTHFSLPLPQSVDHQNAASVAK